jgi:Ni,Fe-hydrogenase III small subunit
MTVEMRYPVASELKEIAGTEENAEIYSVAAACLDKIYIEDSIYEANEVSEEDKMEFIENMTTDQFEKIRDFYETMPTLENKIEFNCKACGKENYIFMNGYLDFFA